MAFAPDGRLFVTEQGGALRVIKNNALLPAPFVTLAVETTGERGLLGVAIDPEFTTNQYIYLYYTATSPTIHNRISRFTADGDVMLPGSEVVLLDLPTLGAIYHNGGAIHFGPDGKLYAAVGDNTTGANAQSMSTLLGKMLRINPDGSIPTDNPFYGSATGDSRLIWALGLRNPFTFSFQAGTGRMFINDVGDAAWEEINDGIAGSNYGWPNKEGPAPNSGYRDPLFVYDHTVGCAITGGAFYNPATAQFPASYAGTYFFADYCGAWIHVFDPSSGTVSDFSSGIGFPVDLQVSPDGSLYYLHRGAGAVNRISYPTADTDADGVTDTTDNCLSAQNVDQANSDAINGTSNRPGADGLGDACDADVDGDGYTNTQETEPALGEDPLAYCDVMRADVDGDGAVSILDLTVVANKFTQSTPPAPVRLRQDADGAISILDLTRMAAVFTRAGE